MWNGSADALLRRERDDIGISLRGGGHSGIPVRATGRHSESLAGADGPPGLRGLIRAGLPLPCQTFPACRNGGEIQDSLGLCRDLSSPKSGKKSRV